MSYRLARNYYHAAVCRQKVQFYTKFSNLLNNERNSYRWWQQAKRLSNISVKKRAVIPDFIDGSGLASSDTEKADLLARAFSSQCSNPRRYTSQHTPAAFHDTPFDVPQLTGDEVFCALRTLPAYKATGGTIPNRLIKKTAPVITESLCYLFNLSLSLGQLPNNWKTATVVPLLKPKSLPSNSVSSRPISLLPCIAKVLDHLVCNHLSAFLYKYKLITPAPYGFVRERSTLDQLVVLTNNIATALDNGQHFESLFLDFSKAFDKVPHPELLATLALFCSTSSLKWFSSYLSNRKLQVRVR